MKKLVSLSVVLLGSILWGELKAITVTSIQIKPTPPISQQVNEKLLAAVNLGKYEDVQASLGLGADCGYVDEQRWSILMHAVEKGDLRIVKLLVGCGANVNYANKGGFSAALMACGHDRYEILRYLISVGAKVSINNNECYDCLSYAASGNEHKILKLLVETGADINGRNCDGATPLMSGSRFMTQAILDLGADINAVDDTGHTAIMLSVIHSDEVKFKILLKHKPNLHVVNNRGETAYDLAVKHDRVNMLPYLKN